MPGVNNISFNFQNNFLTKKNQQKNHFIIHTFKNQKELQYDLGFSTKECYKNMFKSGKETIFLIPKFMYALLRHYR